MRKQNVILSAAKTLLPLLAAAALFSCTKLESSENSGKGLDEESIDAINISIHGSESLDNTVFVKLTDVNTSGSGKLLISSSKSLESATAITLSPDTTLVAAYNTKNKTAYKALPPGFYTPAGDNVVTLYSGDNVSATMDMTFRTAGTSGKTLSMGETYLLPLRVSAEGVKMSSNVVYFVVNCETQFKEKGELLDNPDIATFVFYVNTSDYDPRLVTDYYLQKYTETFQEEWNRTIGNIINLRKSYSWYDEDSGRVSFYLSSDLSYVLNNYDTYIRPLQDAGRKVCISIEGHAGGVGFCNMTDSQIEDFVVQVKAVLDRYPIDGINLWDRYSGYGAEGAPAVNTTSYPKLIKALREAIGSAKLLTLTDHEEPTEYFWDTAATGGIRVGDYIDYAWSGYNAADEYYQVVDPWHQGESCVSSLHPRQPIAGINRVKYGSINAPWNQGNRWESADLKASTDKVKEWVSNGFSNNKMLVFEDAQTSLQDYKEAVWKFSIQLLSALLNGEEEYLYQFYARELDTFYIDGVPVSEGYNKWSKDW